MKQVAEKIFGLRLPLLIFLSLLTIFLGYHASQLKTATDFSKMVPQNHEYIKNYKPLRDLFGGGNQIKVSVSLKEGTILTWGEEETIEADGKVVQIKPAWKALLQMEPSNRK